MKKILLASFAFAALATVAVANNNVVNNTIVKTIPYGDEIKVKLQNKGDDKIEIMYQKKAGSRDLSGATINQGSTITITVEAGCQVFYKVKGSKGPLLLTISADMNGTTQIIKK
ncbi:MAG: hypothetical protein KA319_00875 [Ferruginibacter sp.]|nr:hypothetical protein [Ferruginibacter sp.]